MGELDRVLNRLDKIGETVGRTEGQLQAMSKSIDEIKETTKDQDMQLQSLDKFRTKIIAYATVVSIIFGGVFKLMA